MKLNGDMWKIAIEDARARHAAIVNLIYFTDTQALGLLRLYVTIGLAAASAAAAVFVNKLGIPAYLGWPLLIVTLTLSAGSWNCLQAMETSALNLPGRPPDFWLWATKEATAEHTAFAAYMENLDQKQRQNDKVNIQTSSSLTTAKLCGAATP